MGDLARGAGGLVAVPLAALARWRDGKPMHPRGAVFDAVLERHGASRPWGVPFLDTTGTEGVVVRLSRGAGLPAWLPDLLGLAVRLGGEDGAPVDLLLSSTGRGRLTRVLPALRRDTASAYCSIMAYRSVAGSLRIAALPTTDGVPSDPAPLAAAAVRHPPPGLVPDGPLARFRAPAYAAAQAAR